MSFPLQKGGKSTKSLYQSVASKDDRSKNPNILEESKTNKRLSLNIMSSIENENELMNEESLIRNQNPIDFSLRKSIIGMHMDFILLNFDGSSNKAGKLQKDNELGYLKPKFNARHQLNTKDGFEVEDLGKSSIQLSIEAIFQNILHNVPHNKIYEFKSLTKL